MKAHRLRVRQKTSLSVPRRLVQEAGLSGEVHVTVAPGSLVIRQSEHPRAGWREACRRMHELGEDELLDPEAITTSSWDEEEWEW